MADVSGPTSTRPGSRHRLPPGTMCDDHPERPAVARIQGETDSFGAEYLDLCQECLDKLQAEAIQARTGPCDWCGQHADTLAHIRDADEGSYGRLYRVCAPCRQRESQRLYDEARELLDDDTQPIAECYRCSGDGRDPWNDYLLPCPVCHGEQHP